MVISVGSKQTGVVLEASQENTRRDSGQRAAILDATYPSWHTNWLSFEARTAQGKASLRQIDPKEALKSIIFTNIPNEVFRGERRAK